MVAVLLVFPAGAAAKPFGPVEQEHLQLALKHWGPMPCPFGVSYHLTDSAARLTSNGKAIAYAGDCEVGLSDNLARDGFNYVERCTVLLHELGHVQGREHSSNPADPMFHNLDKMTRHPRVCTRGAKLRAGRCERRTRWVERCYRHWSL